MRKHGQAKPWVVDSSCFITLCVAGVLDIFFTLHSDIRTTDLIADELSVPPRGELAAKGVRIETLSEQAFSGLEKLIASYSGLSIQDASVVVLAQELGGVVFSDDKPLRKCAEQQQIERHGSLWILTEMHRKRLITPSELCVALSEMVRRQRRLPQTEVRRMRQKHNCPEEHPDAGLLR